MGGSERTSTQRKHQRFGVARSGAEGEAKSAACRVGRGVKHTAIHLVPTIFRKTIDTAIMTHIKPYVNSDRPKLSEGGQVIW